jgi:hypothetical protein
MVTVLNSRGDCANDDDYSNNYLGITHRSWQERTSSVLNSNSLKSREAITEFGLTVLLHPRYRPDLPPSDFRLFGALKVPPAV